MHLIFLRAAKIISLISSKFSMENLLKKNNTSLSKDSYNALANRMQPGILKIYCEGTDAEFYKKIFSHYKILATISSPPNVPASRASCTEVMKQVNDAQDPTIIGIIDGDFFHLEKQPRIFRLNFYSIENIIIIYSSKFLGLKTISRRYFNKNSSAYSQKNIHSANRLDYDGIHRSLTPTKKIIEKTYHNFIVNSIKCPESFVQFMDLKLPLLTYSKQRLRFTNKAKGRYQNIFYGYSSIQDTKRKDEIKRIAHKNFSELVITFDDYKLIPINFLELPPDIDSLFEASDRKKIRSLSSRYRKH